MSTKISNLPSGSALSGTEEVPIVQDGATVKTTTQEIADLASSSGATWGAITGTLTDQTDLDTALSGKVPTTRTINGSALSSDVVVSLIPLFCVKNIANATTGGTARYMTFVDSSNVNASEATQRLIIPVATTFYNFCILTSTVQPATGSSVFTILKNGVDTGIVITIPAGSSAGTFSDTTNSVAFSQFDAISIKWVNNATTSSCQVTSLSIASK